MASALIGPEFRQSAVEAFRDDLGGGEWAPPSPAKAAAISVTAILEAALGEGTGPERERLIRRAAEISRSVSHPDHPATGCWEDPVGVETTIGDIRQLVGILHVERTGTRLAWGILERLAALVKDDIDAARVAASRMAFLMQAGRLDTARDLALPVMLAGRRLGSEEILAKVWFNVVIGAQYRGNFPRVEHACRFAAKHAERLGDPRFLGRVAFIRGAVAGSRGDVAQSVEQSWRAATLFDFDGARAMALGNLAEALYRSGHFRASRAARAVILQHGLPLRAVPISLAGYAQCSAGLGDVAGARWAIEQAIAVAANHEEPGIAHGLLECANAAAMVGLDDVARRLWRDGIGALDAGGYHELRLFPDPTVERPTLPGRESFVGAAARATESVTELAPDGVPLGLEVAIR
jgi:hypothetical protein